LSVFLISVEVARRGENIEVWRLIKSFLPVGICTGIAILAVYFVPNLMS